MCVALLLAAGGFVTHEPIRAPDTPCRREVVVAYPTRDLAGAWRHTRRVALRHPGAYAVGESAGGTLALNLAARGLVRGAVVLGAPTRLVGWPPIPGYWRRMHAPQRLRRELWSPASGAPRSSRTGARTRWSRTGPSPARGGSCFPAAT